MPKIGIFFDALEGHLSTRLMDGVFRYTESRPEIELLKWERGIYLDRNTPTEVLNGVDAFLAFSTGPTTQIVTQSGRPYINMSGCVKQDNPAIFDDTEVGRNALRYLYDKGLSSLACVHRSGDYSSRMRRIGFGKESDLFELNAQRLPLDIDEVRAEYVAITTPFEQKVTEWLQVLTKPCGLFCTDDYIARIIADVCKRSSILIPEEVCILGVNNDPEQCLGQSPHLSSIDLDFESLAYHSLEAIMRMLNDIPKTPSIILSPVGIISRQSTDYIDSESPIIKRTIRWIKLHSKEMIHAEDVSDALGVSRQYLNRKLKQELGLTLTDSIRREKIVHAKNALSKTQLPLESIVEQCGYSDLNQLLRQFRKETGETPTQFRRKLSSAQGLRRNSLADSSAKHIEHEA